MKARDWGWKSRDGLKMFAQGWEPEKSPKTGVRSERMPLRTPVFGYSSSFREVLIMHGAADRVTYPHCSQEFANLVPETIILL